MSSYFDGLGFAHCCAKAQAHAMIVAHLKEVAEMGLFRVPRDLASSLNDRMPGAVEIQTKSLKFPHSLGTSNLDIATAGSVGAGRGLTLSFLHLSECAQYPGQDSFLSILPAVSKADDTVVVLESTAQGRTGIGETFYEYWNGAHLSGAKWNGFTPIFLSWLDDPACHRPETEAEDAPATDFEKELMGKPFFAKRSQIAWMRMVLEGECRGSELMFNQEYPHCVIGDTRISTSAGMIKVRDAVAGMDTESGRVETAISQGVQKTVKIKTSSGRELTGTLNHPMMGEDGSLVRLSESLGKKLRIARPMFSENYFYQTWGGMLGSQHSIPVTEELGRFLGYFMGDGSYYKGTISIVCTKKDEDVVADVGRLFDLFFGKHEVRTTGLKRGCSEVRVSRKGFEEFGRRLGILRESDGNSIMRKVGIPVCIWNSPRSVVREFLRGLFEADGFNGYGQPRVSFFSKYPDFLRDIQHLLLGFGITSRVKSRPAHNKTHSYTANTLELRTEESIRFNDQIGFISDRKRNRNGYQPKWRNKGTYLGIEWSDEVVSVEDAGEQEVFDLTIEKLHLFCANGLLSHNSPEVAFVATGDPAFTQEEIRYALSTKAVKKDIRKGHFERDGRGAKFIENPRGKTFLYEYPEPRAWYYIGVDCARGIEQETGRATGDFAAYVVLNGTTGNVAARFCDWVNPIEMARDVDAAGRYYNNAMMNIELTGNLGLWCQQVLRDQYTYPNWYIWKGKDDKSWGKSKSNALGFETNARTRDLLLATFRGKLHDGMKNVPGGLSLKDEELIRQMDMMTMATGMRWEIEHGHDDVFMACCFAVLACAQYPPPNIASFRGNVLDRDKAGHPAITALSPQESLKHALLKDQMMILKKPRNHRPALLGGI